MMRSLKNCIASARREMQFIPVFFLLFPLVSAQAQEREGIFIASLGEALLYSAKSAAYGGGFILGYGDKVSMGLRVLYALDNDGVAALESCLFLRYTILHRPDHGGPFVQLNAGPALFAKDSPITIPARAGTISAGITVGWRFMLGKHWYIEPAVRAGYPYIAGGGLSAGFWF